MNYLEILKKSYPNFKEIIFSPIIFKSETVGWEAIAYDIYLNSIGGGSAIDKTTAMRICIAECLERSLFKQIINDSNLSESCFIQSHPTTCGFACGFENAPTKYRSLAEAIERWAWSNWIDFKFELQNIKSLPNQSKLFDRMIFDFDTTLFYQKKFLYQNREYQFGVVLGFSGNGIFSGSRVCSLDEKPWEHAAIEAFRNFKNFEKNKNISKTDESNFIKKRISYFGSNKLEALNQINSANKLNWPRLEPMLEIEIETNLENVFLHRTLMKNWIPWNVGLDNRFVY